MTSQEAYNTINPLFIETVVEAYGDDFNQLVAFSDNITKFLYPTYTVVVTLYNAPIERPYASVTNWINHFLYGA